MDETIKTLDEFTKLYLKMIQDSVEVANGTSSRMKEIMEVYEDDRQWVTERQTVPQWTELSTKEKYRYAWKCFRVWNHMAMVEADKKMGDSNP